MRTVAILSLSVVLLAAAPPETVDDRYRALASSSSPKVDIDKHYKEGQRLFGEKNFALALAEFEKVDELAPNQAQVYSWIAACLNELGRHDEARQRLESALELLRAGQKSAAEQGQPVPPIDIGYYTLLARIQVNLGEYEQAVATLESFPVPDDGSEAATKARQAIDAGKASVKAQLAALGTGCFEKGDLDCARAMLARAQALKNGTPSVWATLARDWSSRAERAPSTSDEEKAAKSELQAKAVASNRLWVEAEPTVEAKRGLARALTATKQKESYEEAVEILTALAGSEGADDDGSVQLDLAVAYAALEQWDQAASAATSHIALDPDDPLGQGYCLRSLARFQLGGCPDALEDGEHCKNADGPPRALKHLDVCRDRVARAVKDEANKVAAREASLRGQCTHLYKRGQWARSFLDGIEFDDLVEVIGDFKASEAKCAPYFDEAEKSASGNGFSSPTPVLCAAGAKTASLPMNLSTRKKEDIASLLDQTKAFLELCRSTLDPGQAEEVLQGMHKVEEALERPR